MSINAEQLRELVIRPALRYLSDEIPYSEEAGDLLMMTAAHESRLGTYLKQVNGPALGIYQMEPATHDDIWNSFIDYRECFVDKMEDISSHTESSFPNLFEQMIHNLFYATAMARVHYWRVPEPLPKKSEYKDPLDYYTVLAQYCKKYWNTHKGKATVQDYRDAYIKLCL